MDLSQDNRVHLGMDTSFSASKQISRLVLDLDVKYGHELELGNPSVVDFHYKLRFRMFQN